MKRFVRRIAASRILWAAAALLLLYTLGGFLLAPWLAERYIPQFAQERLDERASVGKVRFNPFLLTLEITDLRLEGKGERPLLAVQRLFADLELAGLIERAWTFADIRLTGATLGLHIDRDGRLDWSALIARLRDPDAPQGPPPAVIVRRALIENAKLGLVDLSGAMRASASIDDLHLELHELATIASRRGRYALTLRGGDGASLSAQGELALQPLAVSGELALRGARLATAWQFFRERLKIAEPAGEISLSGRYAYGAKSPDALTLEEVAVEVSGLELTPEAGGDALVRMQTLRLTDGSLRLPERVARAATLEISQGAIGASVSGDGVLDWQRIVHTPGAAAVDPPSDAAASARAQPWQVHLGKALIERVALAYADRGRPVAYEARAQSLDADFGLAITTGAAPRVLVENLRAALSGAHLAAEVADVPPATLESLTLNGGHIDTAERAIRASVIEVSGAKAELARDADGPAGLLKAFLPGQAPAPEAAATGEPWRVQLDEIGFARVALAYRDASFSPPLATRVGELKGRLKLTTDAGGVLAEDLELSADDLRLADASAGAAPLASLKAFAISGARIESGTRTVAARSVRLSDGAFELLRGREGPQGLLRVFQSGESARPQTAARSPAQSAPWRYRIDALAVERIAATLADASFEPAIGYPVRIASATLQGIDSTASAPIAFRAALEVAGTGSIRGAGNVSQNLRRAQARIRASAIPLEPLQPLLARHAALVLKSGALSAAAEVTYGAEKGPALVAAGTASIAGLHVDEAATGERFLAWKTLAADAIRLTVGPDELAVGELRVDEPGMKLVIAKDRSVNLTQVLRKEPAPKADATAAPASEKSASAESPRAEAPPPYPFRIERIRVVNGTLDFADLSLVLPFSTRVHEVAGSIVNVTSEPDVRARIELAGTVAEYGEAHAQGSVNLSRPTEFLDITARFENVQLPPFSAYSATFAGRKIEAGKLWLTLEYKIADTRLAGENKIMLEDFVLGERVESPGALDLPLDLAVALLKDSRGRIRLAVPVRGDVDNPQFDYGTLIRTAIGNAIRRVITAPFRMLASLFGKGDSETLGRIDFEPGSARIAPPEREKLNGLAKALQERPQLKLVVRGPYAPGVDAERLKRAGARRELAAALGTKLAPGENPGPIAYASVATQKALEALLEKAEPGGLAQLAERYAKRTGRPAQRVNPLLGALGRASSDAAFYEAIFERLVELYPLPETAVRVLATDRSQAIVTALTEAGVRGARLETGGITPVEPDRFGSIEAEFSLETMRDSP